MRPRWLVGAAALAWLTSCEPPPSDGPAYPAYPAYSASPPYPAYPATAAAAQPQPAPPQPVALAAPLAPAATATPADVDHVVAVTAEYAFAGGRIDFELHQAGTRVAQVMRNHYMIPVVVAWEVSGLVNLEEQGPSHGVVVLPAAARPDGVGVAVEVATLEVVDPRSSWNRHIDYHARFGDPAARPASYAYALPFRGTFSVLQGFHGAFSHRGSNEYAVDFDCPVATTVRAARPGVVVVTHDAAQGSGTTPEFLDYRHVNFVLVQHDDGTLGEYMHLSPSGVEVQPGQRVERGQALALSGNTGYSTTPHLHFQVMTAATDGIAAQSFPFELAVARGRVEQPAQGQSYTAWE